MRLADGARLRVLDSALRVTSTAWTRADWNSSANDWIELRDGAGTVVHRSTQHEGRCHTFAVPGDTVRIRERSMPGDDRSSAGFGVVNICPVPAPGSNQPPVAMPGASAVGGTAPLVVAFDTSTSFDPDGTIVAPRLDPGDGGPEYHLAPSVDTVVHVDSIDRRGGWPNIADVMAPTTFTATLTVTDDDGEESSATVDLTVQPYDGSLPGTRSGLPAFLLGPNGHCTFDLATGTFHDPWGRVHPLGAPLGGARAARGGRGDPARQVGWPGRRIPAARDGLGGRDLA